MNSNWIEIVETLQPYKVSDSIERDYHKEIENCFRFLGWKRSNGTIKSEVSKENGVVRTFDFLKNNPNRERNFSMKDPISLSDGNVVFINTQWGNSGAIKKYFQNFLKYIGTMYPIYSK